MILVADDAECNRWLNLMPRREMLELVEAVLGSPKNAGVWQKPQGKDLQGNDLTEGTFIKVDPLGDWIEDHGGKREWSDELMAVGMPPPGDGRGRRASDVGEPVRVDHCGLVDQPDPFAE